MSGASASPDRAAQRNKLVRLAVLLGGVERVVSVFNALLRVGLLAYLLSNRDYGLYVAVLGVVTTANLLDFGMHYGVVSAVSRASGADDAPLVRRILSTGAGVYSLISLAALAIVIPGLVFGPLEWIFGLRPDQVVEARVIAIIGFSGLLLSLPTKVASAGLMGLQQSYVVSAFRTVSGVVQTASLAAVALAWRGALVPVAVVSAATDLGSGLLLGAWSAIRDPERCAISPRAFDRSLVRGLMGTGLTFFVANLANLLRRSLVTVAVAHSLGTAAVPRFSVPLALFTTGMAFTDIVAASLWPAYGEAVARRDWPWIERAFRLSTRAGLLTALGIAALGVVAGDEVLHIWTAKIPTPPLALMAWLALWLVSQAATSAASSLLNGIGQNRRVMWVVLVEGVLTFSATAGLVRFFGIVGTGAAMALAGVVSATYLSVFAVPAATERNVHNPLPAAARAAVAAGLAIAAGLAAERAFQRTLPRLLTGASVAAAVYGVSLWLAVLSSSERARLTEYVGRRLRRAA